MRTHRALATGNIPIVTRRWLRHPPGSMMQAKRTTSRKGGIRAREVESRRGKVGSCGSKPEEPESGLKIWKSREADYLSTAGCAACARGNLMTSRKGASPVTTPIAIRRYRFGTTKRIEDTAAKSIPVRVSAEA
jgi:hypothetical protein